MMNRISYLDCNATTPVRPEVAAAVAEALGGLGNPSSVHRLGRAGRRAVESARLAVAALVRADPDGIIFTSGGTEANALALRGCGATRLLVSAIEHDSVLASAELAAAAGATVERIPVTGAGRIDLQALDTALRSTRNLAPGAAAGPVLVSLMAANNETGVVQPVAGAAALARAHGALLHVDAAQAAGRIPVSMAALGADLLTLSAHKLGGPPGVGALVAGAGIRLTPLLTGGAQERGRRAGTENLPGIVGFGVAAGTAADGLEAEAERLSGLRDRLEAAIREVCPAAPVHGRPPGGLDRECLVDRLPNTTCIGMPGVTAETQVMALDLAGVAVSAGAACSSGKVRPSHVLEAMGVDAEAARQAIRISLGWTTTDADIMRCAAAWTELWVRARAQAGLAA